MDFKNRAWIIQGFIKMNVIMLYTQDDLRLFKGTKKTTRTCGSCKHKPEESSEDFLSLTVSLQNSQNLEQDLQEQARENKRVDSVYCYHCRRKTDMETKQEMMKFPEHLIVELKRSETNSSWWSSEVIIRPHIEVSSLRYELYAVVNRKTLWTAGRYNADIKCEDEIWHRFEDRNVSESPLNRFFRDEIPKHRSSDARLLVFRLRDQTAGHTGGDLSPRSCDLPLTEEKNSSLEEDSDPSQIQTGAQRQAFEAQKQRLITQVVEAVHGVTCEEAEENLYQNQWNLTLTVQQLKVKHLHYMTQHPREKCRHTLISFNWDLQRAFRALTQQYRPGTTL